jgi:hypothetical protein
MKRLILIIVAVMGMTCASFATDKTDQQRLTPQEFREKQQNYITKAAGLTTDEAEKFFPIYFELQEKKRELNDDIWKLMKEGRKETTTESRFGEIVDKVYDLRIAIDKLDKSYMQKFRKIIPNKKIYKVQDAEVRFRRDMLKDMSHGRPAGKQQQRPAAKD